MVNISPFLWRRVLFVLWGLRLYINKSEQSKITILLIICFMLHVLFGRHMHWPQCCHFKFLSSHYIIVITQKNAICMQVSCSTNATTIDIYTRNSHVSPAITGITGSVLDTGASGPETNPCQIHCSVTSVVLCVVMCGQEKLKREPSNWLSSSRCIEYCWIDLLLNFNAIFNGYWAISTLWGNPVMV